VSHGVDAAVRCFAAELDTPEAASEGNGVRELQNCCYHLPELLALFPQTARWKPLGIEVLFSALNVHFSGQYLK